MSVYRCFPLPRVEGLLTALIPKAELDCAPKGESGIFIYDSDIETHSGSLLFQAALSFASDGEQVTYIRFEPFKSRPLAVHGMTPPSPRVLENIKMIYLSSGCDFVSYLARFHTLHYFPVAVIVDGFQHYLEDEAENQAAEVSDVRKLALLEDTLGFLEEKKGQHCHRLVSISNCSSIRSLMSKYFRDIWYLSKNERDPEKFFMTDTSLPSFRIHYGIRNEAIHLLETERLPTQLREVES